MITLVRHGIEPLQVHAAIAEMEKEAKEQLKGDVVCVGSKNIHDPEFNILEKHGPHHISVETFWDKAPSKNVKQS